jgi:diguanylate cyclase (GGDEF)-like protein
MSENGSELNSGVIFMPSMRDKKKFNLLMEFSDRKIEREFFQQQMNRSFRFLKPIILVMGILNTLFIIPDYFFVQNGDKYLPIAISKIFLLVLTVGLYLRINNFKNSSILSYWITAFEAAFILQFLIVLYLYEKPSFLIQAFGVMVILIAVYLVPNRSIFKISVSLFAGTSFIVLSIFYIKNVVMSEFLAVIVYMTIVIILSCIMSFNNDYNLRIQYINDLELKRLSDTDYLTGAYNRAKLDEELNRWAMYSRRYTTPLSIIILDLDDFKSINDTYGHLTGDKVIIETVELIKNEIRNTDLLARWGGEEFLILLPNTDSLKAIEIAERFRIEIENHTFTGIDLMTCSFGVAQLEPDEVIESMFQRADHMLYEAKRAGKNKVMG